MAQPPKWADALMKRVLADEQCQREPRLIWRRAHDRSALRDDGTRVRVTGSKPESSSGYCDAERIVITAGADRKDQMVVLLHELAHWLVPRGEGHGTLFWFTAFRLFRRYRASMRVAKSHSYEYRRLARIGYEATKPRVAFPAQITGRSSELSASG